MKEEELPSDLPDDFDLESAKHMETVVADGGTTYRVLRDFNRNETFLVYNDIVDFSALSHPMVDGVKGLLAEVLLLSTPAVLAALGSSMAVSPLGLAGTGATIWVLGMSVIGGFAGLALSNKALYETRVGDWLGRFGEWYDVNHLITDRGDRA